MSRASIIFTGIQNNKLNKQAQDTIDRADRQDRFMFDSRIRSN